VTTPRYGWAGSVSDFLSARPEELQRSLTSHYQGVALEPPATSQIQAWQHSFDVLRQTLQYLLRLSGPSTHWTVVFEYELPRERGRRPDVLLLASSAVYVLEFKDRPDAIIPDIDQVAAYARDLGAYHAGCHALPVFPILVPTLAKGLATQIDEVRICPPVHLAELLADLASELPELAPIDPTSWLSADYAPLPSLVTAARALFNHEPLPTIRRAQSAGVADAVTALIRIADRARAHHERHLALITGVPGAGKTLVGLRFVYDDALAGLPHERPAVFLSGNKPLVKVLQHVLKSSVFVQDVHGFLKEYGAHHGRRPSEHVWVYDEAQRAWDAARVKEKRGHATSEPEDFVRLGGRMPEWAMIVGLIGEGQEIHLGEEAGLGQWNDALKTVGEHWIVHCPSKVANLFLAAEQVVTNDGLDLTVSLRTHLAENVQDWVACLLSGDLRVAANLAHSIHRQGFEMYVTTSFEDAESYVRTRYEGQLDKRYGLIASSKAKNLVPYGIRNDYAFTKNLREGPWYADAPSSKYSCCQLRDVATEFSCQGLELDFPIVAWGSDFTWRGSRWLSPPQPRSRAHDPHRLRENSYRVLLTRGRDGFVVFVPPSPDMASTHKALVASGLRPLNESLLHRRALVGLGHDV
jgi:hypothetical protein